MGLAKTRMPINLAHYGRKPYKFRFWASKTKKGKRTCKLRRHLTIPPQISRPLSMMYLFHGTNDHQIIRKSTITPSYNCGQTLPLTHTKINFTQVYSQIISHFLSKISCATSKEFGKCSCKLQVFLHLFKIKLMFTHHFRV